MFLNEQDDSYLAPNHKFDRVVIGAGALGIFLSSIIQNEFPNSNLTIISKSLPNLPIFIHNLQNEIKETNLPKPFLVDNLNLNSIMFVNKNIIFYICIPPESIHLSFQYINNLICNLADKKNVYIVFLNNGIIDYQLFHKLKNTYIKNISFFLIRSIVISGFIRSSFIDKTIIKNTSGNKIYYGIFQNPFPIKTNYILPMKYFEWIYTEDIFIMEKAKFLVNFVLGLCIGANLIPNAEIFTLLSKERRKEIILNYCSLFPNNEITPQYLEKYFNDSVENTFSNINSVSFSWYHGNKKPIEYFIANIKKMTYSNKNKEAQHFFKNLITLYS